MKMQVNSHDHGQIDQQAIAAAIPGCAQVLLLEDDPVFAATLTRAVQALDPGWTVLHCASVAEALRALPACGHGLRMALVDLTLPDGSGLALVRAMREQFPQAPALVVSSLASEQSVLSAIGEGARGYLHKGEPMQALATAMGQVMQGNYPISPSLARYLFQQVQVVPEHAPLAQEGDAGTGNACGEGDTRVQLTPKEAETLRCISQGMSYAEAAGQMGVSLSTVQSHIRSLYRKLEVRSQMQAVGKAREQGLL